MYLNIWHNKGSNFVKIVKKILNCISIPWKVSKQEAYNKSVLIPVVNFVWILNYCNKDHFSCSQWIRILIVWNTMEDSETLHWFHSLCSPYALVMSTSGSPKQFHSHRRRAPVWNLKGCSIRICGFWRKKLLLSWGLLNKDLIALNACVQGKCYAIQLPVLGIPEWEQLLDIIHHLAWFEV